MSKTEIFLQRGKMLQQLENSLLLQKKDEMKNQSSSHTLKCLEICPPGTDAKKMEMIIQQCNHNEERISMAINELWEDYRGHDVDDWATVTKKHKKKENTKDFSEMNTNGARSGSIGRGRSIKPSGHSTEANSMGTGRGRSAPASGHRTSSSAKGGPSTRNKRGASSKEDNDETKNVFPSNDNKEGKFEDAIEDENAKSVEAYNTLNSRRGRDHINRQQPVYRRKHQQQRKEYAPSDETKTSRQKHHNHTNSRRGGNDTKENFDSEEKQIQTTPSPPDVKLQLTGAWAKKPNFVTKHDTLAKEKVKKNVIESPKKMQSPIRSPSPHKKVIVSPQQWSLDDTTDVTTSIAETIRSPKGIIVMSNSPKKMSSPVEASPSNNVTTFQDNGWPCDPALLIQKRSPSVSPRASPIKRVSSPVVNASPVYKSTPSPKEFLKLGKWDNPETQGLSLQFGTFSLNDVNEPDTLVPSSEWGAGSSAPLNGISPKASVPSPSRHVAQPTAQSLSSPKVLSPGRQASGQARSPAVNTLPRTPNQQQQEPTKTSNTGIASARTNVPPPGLGILRNDQGPSSPSRILNSQNNTRSSNPIMRQNNASVSTSDHNSSYQIYGANLMARPDGFNISSVGSYIEDSNGLSASTSGTNETGLQTSYTTSSRSPVDENDPSKNDPAIVFSSSSAPHSRIAGYPMMHFPPPSNMHNAQMYHHQAAAAGGYSGPPPPGIALPPPYYNYTANYYPGMPPNFAYYAGAPAPQYHQYSPRTQQYIQRTTNSGSAYDNGQHLSYMHGDLQSGGFSQYNPSFPSQGFHNEGSTGTNVGGYSSSKATQSLPLQQPQHSQQSQQPQRSGNFNNIKSSNLHNENTNTNSVSNDGNRSAFHSQSYSQQPLEWGNPGSSQHSWGSNEVHSQGIPSNIQRNAQPLHHGHLYDNSGYQTNLHMSYIPASTQNNIHGMYRHNQSSQQNSNVNGGIDGNGNPKSSNTGGWN